MAQYGRSKKDNSLVILDTSVGKWRKATPQEEADYNSQSGSVAPSPL